MKNWIIKLLGGVTLEQYKTEVDWLKDRISELSSDVEGFKNSYKYNWVDYNSTKNFALLKKKLYKLVKNEKPKCDYDYDCLSSATSKFVYKDGSYLCYTKYYRDDSEYYCGFVTGYGNISQDFAKKMYLLANSLLKAEEE